MAVEWLLRYDSEHAALARRAGHVALLVSGGAVCAHGYIFGLWPGADELRVRGILRACGVGPDATAPPVPPKPTASPRDRLDDILDSNTFEPAPAQATPRPGAEPSEGTPRSTGVPAARRSGPSPVHVGARGRGRLSTTPPSPTRVGPSSGPGTPCPTASPPDRQRLSSRTRVVTAPRRLNPGHLRVGRPARARRRAVDLLVLRRHRLPGPPPGRPREVGTRRLARLRPRRLRRPRRTPVRPHRLKGTPCLKTSALLASPRR